jgi:hypothetical protein
VATPEFSRGCLFLFSETATELLKENPDLQVGDSRPRIVPRWHGGPSELAGYILQRLNTPGQPSTEFEVPCPPSVVAVTFDFKALLEEEVREPGALFQLSPRRFEELVADLWDKLGYSVQLTAQTRDGGRDIIAIGGTEARVRFLIECKRYTRSRKVSIEHVRSLYGVKAHEQASKAILATTSGFTPTALAFFDCHRWELEGRDYAGVLDWARLVCHRSPSKTR